MCPSLKCKDVYSFTSCTASLNSSVALSPHGGANVPHIPKGACLKLSCATLLSVTSNFRHDSCSVCKLFHHSFFLLYFSHKKVKLDTENVNSPSNGFNLSDHTPQQVVKSPTFHARTAFHKIILRALDDIMIVRMGKETSSEAAGERRL